MTAYNALKSVHKTFGGVVVDVITLNQLWPAIEVENEDMTNDLFFTQDATDPVADANNTTRVAPGSTKVVKAYPLVGTSTHEIRVLGNGGAYHVEGVQ